MLDRSPQSSTEETELLSDKVPGTEGATEPCRNCQSIQGGKGTSFRKAAVDILATRQSWEGTLSTTPVTSWSLAALLAHTVSQSSAHSEYT